MIAAAIDFMGLIIMGAGTVFVVVWLVGAIRALLKDM